MTDPPTAVSRRTLTGLAAVAGVGVPLLAACSSDDSNQSTDAGSDAGSGDGFPVATSDI